MSTSDELMLASGKKGTILENKKLKLLIDSDNENVIYSVRHMAAKAGFKHTDEALIATAASELATNILRYAGKGDMEINIIKDIGEGFTGVELLASDNGPGIENIELAMQEQYSSLPHSLGLGLPSVRRIMDEFFIESVCGKGTRILARKWRKYGKS